MQTSTTRLKKPLYLWLARTIALGIILTSIGIAVSSLTEIPEKLKHEGITDIYWVPGQNGSVIVQQVSPTVQQMGVAIGDKILNYEDELGKLGTPVTLHIQRGNSPARDVTVLRDRPANNVVFGAMQLGLSFAASVNLAFLLSAIAVVVGAVGSLLLYGLRSNDWMALLTATVLAAFAIPNFPSTNPAVIIFYQFLGPLIFTWIILFPNGKLRPRWSWAILALILITLVGPILELLVPIDRGLTVVGWILVLAIIATVYFRYRYTFTPTERQQSKWVVTALIIGLLPLLITDMIYRTTWYAHPDESNIAYFFNQVSLLIFILSLTVGIFFSTLRYRLWDVDTFISRAIVYSSLTAILGLLGFVITVLTDFMLKQVLGNQSGLLAVAVAALPIAALFNPVRDRLQQAVDRRFKAEEIDFENTFIEFTAEVRSLFTTKELSALLARQAVEQLDIAYASVFLNGQSGPLKHIQTICSAEETFEPSLDDKTIEKIKKGQLTSPDGNYAQSLVVPLLVPRSRKPSLLGALVLGPRLQGVGYSTAMVNSLKRFGEEVGKAFYVAEVRGNKKLTLIENE